VIRNAVLHLENEQPLLGDLYRLPEPTDVGLLCTNVRTLDGRRPVSIDDVGSAFFFPYRVIRFIEIPVRSIGAAGADAAAGAGSGSTPEPSDGQDLDLELDEEFLRRVKAI
jgi:hypothetical protein